MASVVVLLTLYWWPFIAGAFNNIWNALLKFWSIHFYRSLTAFQASRTHFLSPWKKQRVKMGKIVKMVTHPILWALNMFKSTVHIGDFLHSTFPFSVPLIKSVLVTVLKPVSLRILYLCLYKLPSLQMQQCQVPSLIWMFQITCTTSPNSIYHSFSH